LGTQSKKIVAYEMKDEEATTRVAYFNRVGKIELYRFYQILSPLAKDK